MTHKRITYEIEDYIWEEYKKYENFYTSNNRDSRSKFIKSKGKEGTCPVFNRTNIEKDLRNGISPSSRIRINVFYEDEETNPENYKIITRIFDENNIQEVPYVNNSIYNN